MTGLTVLYRSVPRDVYPGIYTQDVYPAYTPGGYIVYPGTYTRRVHSLPGYIHPGRLAYPAYTHPWRLAYPAYTHPEVYWVIHHPEV